MSCPHCHIALDLSSFSAGQAVTCPSCQRAFTIPQPMINMNHAAPARSVTSQRSKKTDQTTTFLLAGILFFQFVMVCLMGAWEVRFQLLRAKMQEATSELERALNKSR